VNQAQHWPWLEAPEGNEVWARVRGYIEKHRKKPTDRQWEGEQGFSKSTVQRCLDQHDSEIRSLLGALEPRFDGT
jgi:hypothetical protein